MDIQTVENHIVEYAQRRRALYLSFIRRKMPMDRDTAESLFHDALLQCWKTRHNVRGDNFAAYFRGVLRNVMLTYRHRLATKQRETPMQFSGLTQQEQDEKLASIPNGALAEQILSSLTDAERRMMVKWANGERGLSAISSRTFQLRARLREKFAACRAT